MHDAMHTIIFHDRALDQTAGWFLGNVFLGISGKWWRDEHTEHTEHHLFTNTVIEGVGFSDPQMFEEVWVQDMMVAPFLYSKLPRMAQHIIFKYQHLCVVPALVFVAPYVIKLVAFSRERRPMELFGQALYFVWVAALLSVFPSWHEAIAYYCMVDGGAKHALLERSVKECFVTLQGNSDNAVVPASRLEVTALGAASMLPKYLYDTVSGLARDEI